MSRTAAAQLARLKLRYAKWMIRPVAQGHGDGFTAQQWGTGKHGRPPVRIHARNVTEPATKQAEFEDGSTEVISGVPPGTEPGAVPAPLVVNS